MATPLHNHTYFSAYDGLSKPVEIAERVVELGYGACGCTDHGVVAGHIEFYKAMEKVGVKPLLGVETYQAPMTRHERSPLKDKVSQLKVENFHLLLLAQNQTGLRNLWAMNTESHASGFHYSGRVDWELLTKYNEGIIATSACSLGLMQQALMGNPHLEEPDTILQRYLNIFGDRFYLELSTYPREEQHVANIRTVDLAKHYGVPLVYANDAHYAKPEQYELHEALIALKQQKKLKDPVQDLANPKGRPHHEQALYIMGENEVRQHLDHLATSDVDEAIANSDKIAGLCNVNLPQFRQRLPLYVPDKPYKTGREMLFDLVQQGFQGKVRENHDVYFERVQSELQVIYSADLVDYFLMVRDYVNFASRAGILVGPGRGSVGGSLIAYLLDITQVDPIRYGLIFERFYNAGRETSLPDIDIDFPQRERDKIKQFLMQRYGKEHVADIGTVIRLGPKSAVLDMARVQSVPLKPDVTAITKTIDKAFDAGLQPDWETILTAYGSELEPYMQKYPLVFEWAQDLAESSKGAQDDHVKTYGTHASGVIVADEPLGENFPLRWVADEKKLVSQWDMRDAESLGFQKVDILGLTKLDTLDEVNRILVDSGREPIDYHALQYENHPDEMWQLLDKGASVGLFQVEDGGMVKQIAKAMKVRSIDDAAVLVALNRPGPLRSGAFEKYMNGRKGGINSVHHPLVQEVCDETHGVFLYQEQVIEFMTRMGYSLMEADDIRSIMGKKKVEKLDAEYPRYMKNAFNYGMSKEQAELIWQDLIGFAKYGFNKSHAVEYAIILLWCLYAKWRYPREFLVAAIRTVDKKSRARYVQEAQRLKIPVYPPTFGKSDAQSAVYDDGIMMGYSDINGLGIAPAQWLTTNTWPGMTQEALRAILTSDEGKVVQANGRKRVAITEGHIGALQVLGMFPDTAEEYTPEKRMEIEEEMLKVAISDESAKILEEHKEMLDENCVPLAATMELGEYTIAGVIREITQSKTKHGKDYVKIKVIDDSGDEVTIFVWNDKLKKLSFIFRHRTAGIFQIKRTDFGASLIDAAILYPKTLTAKTEYAKLTRETAN